MAGKESSSLFTQSSGLCKQSWGARAPAPPARAVTLLGYHKHQPGATHMSVDLRAPEPQTWSFFLGSLEKKERERKVLFSCGSQKETEFILREDASRQK